LPTIRAGLRPAPGPYATRPQALALTQTRGPGTPRGSYAVTFASATSGFGVSGPSTGGLQLAQPPTMLNPNRCCEIESPRAPL
jgi:hypothetical protein